MKFNYFLLFVLLTNFTKGQDIIYKTDGTEVRCKILKNTLQEVQYKKIGDSLNVFALEHTYIHHLFEHDIYYPDTSSYSKGAILIGIGSLIDTTDYTSATFDCFKFFADHPIIFNGEKRARIALVDHPSEAQYAITGLIEGAIKLALTSENVTFPFKYNYNLTFNINIWKNGRIVKKLKVPARDYLTDTGGNIIQINRWPPGDIKYYIYYKLFEKAQKALVELINSDKNVALTIWNFNVPFIEPVLSKNYLANLQKRRIEYYPYKTLNYFRNERTMDPWEELKDFSTNFQVGLPFENYQSIGYSGVYDGMAQLNFPVFIRPEAPFEYIEIGNNFIERGQFSSASRAYWSALNMISKTFSSRSVKEKLRYLAYNGLFNVATLKGQKEYAKSFKVAIDLINNYLQGQQGKDDEIIFNNEMSKAKEAEAAKRKAQGGLNLGFLVQTFQVGMSLAGGSIGNVSNPIDVINSGITIAGKVGELNAAEANKNHLIDQLNERLTNNYQSLKNQIGDDATIKFSGSGSFLANEVVFFVATSNSLEGYLKILKKYSMRYQNLQTVLDEFENNYDPVESVLKIGDQISEIEKSIALKEKILAIN